MGHFEFGGQTEFEYFEFGGQTEFGYFEFGGQTEFGHLEFGGQTEFRIIKKVGKPLTLRCSMILSVISGQAQKSVDWPNQIS